MASLSLYIFISYFLLNCWVVLGQILQNKTIDDNDPAIRYTGQWTKSEAIISLNTGGTHMYTQDPNARATFEFTGVAVYFLSPLWPYDVTTQVQLDSRSPEILDLKDYSRPDTGGGWETVASHVVWSAQGLQNGPHVLTMSVGAGKDWAVVDGFVVTWSNGSSSAAQSVTTTQDTLATEGTFTTQGTITAQPPSSLSATPTISTTVVASVTENTTLSLNPSSKPHSLSPPGRVNPLVIGLPVAIGFLALVIVALICYYFYLKHRDRRHQPRVNLEEEFPFIPRSPPALSITPLASASTVDSPTSPETLLVAQSPEQEYYAMVPLATHQSRSTLYSSSAGARTSCQNTWGKPPSYYESVTAHRRSRRELVRKSRSVLSNPD